MPSVAKREHRLTDLLALVLEAHIGLHAKLLAASGLHARGAAIARLWSENKAGARYQPEQLPDYADDLPTQPSARQLITIVDALSEVPFDGRSPDAPRWEGFTRAHRWRGQRR